MMMTISRKFYGLKKAKLYFMATTMLPKFGETNKPPTVRRTPSLLGNTVVVTSWFVGVLSTVELKNL